VTSDDLPEPDGPITRISRSPARSRPSSSSISASRPWKRSASSAEYGHPRVRTRQRSPTHPGGQHDLASVGSDADAELRAIRFGQRLQADRGVALPVRRHDRLLLAERAVEADREGPRHVAGERATHPHDAVDVREQRLGRCLAVARAQDDQLDGSPRGAERLRDRCGRDGPGVAIRGLKEQTALAALAAEVDHRRLERTQLAE